MKILSILSITVFMYSCNSFDAEITKRKIKKNIPWMCTVEMDEYSVLNTSGNKAFNFTVKTVRNVDGKTSSSTEIIFLNPGESEVLGSGKEVQFKRKGDNCLTDTSEVILREYEVVGQIESK